MEASKLPGAPDLSRLNEVQPEINVLNPGRWHRIDFAGGPYPTKWNKMRYLGPTDARFDHHEIGERGRALTQTRGIFYCASNIPTCLADVFQFNRAVDPNAGNPWLVSFELVRTVRLLDLSGGFPLRVGASQAINTSPRRYARNWSRGFYTGYPEIEGLYYRTSMTGDIATVLFERVLTENPFSRTPIFHRPLNDPMLSVPLQETCVDIGCRALW